MDKHNVGRIEYYLRKAQQTVCAPCRARYIAMVIQIAETMTKEDIEALAPQIRDAVRQLIEAAHAKDFVK